MNTIKAITTKYWQLKTDKLNALTLLFVAPSLIYIALRFVTAMGWRLVGNTPYYQAGFVISALCILTLVISLITISIVGNNSFNRKGKRSDIFQGLAFGLTCFLFCVLITSTPPANKLVNQMLGNIYYLEAVTDESFVKLKHTIENSLLPPRKVRNPVIQKVKFMKPQKLTIYTLAIKHLLIKQWQEKYYPPNLRRERSHTERENVQHQ
jgi:hypothetical protein